jgi:hypothetical protein
LYDDAAVRFAAYLDDRDDTLLGQLVDALGVEQAGKVAVQALVPADELVREGKALRGQTRRIER